MIRRIQFIAYNFKSILIFTNRNISIILNIARKKYADKLPTIAPNAPKYGIHKAFITTFNIPASNVDNILLIDFFSAPYIAPKKADTAEKAAAETTNNGIKVHD